MVFNRFSIRVLARVLLLFASLVVWSAIFLRIDLIFTQLIIAAVVVLQVYDLIHYVSRTNKELARFLDSIRDTDFTARFSRHDVDPSFEKLNRSFGDLITKLGATETEKSAQGLFLGALIEEIPFGLIVMEADGQLRFINSQAQQMLDISNIRNWEKLKTDQKHILSGIANMASGRPHLLHHNGLELTVSISTLTIKGELLRIISVKNIQTELRKNETDAWHKLIRVLTHEIMNSITPISSITETLKSLLEDKKSVEGETLDDIKEAVETIKTRSTGMLSFVKRYRQLSRLPEPQLEVKNLLTILERAVHLMANQYQGRSITLDNTTNTTDVHIYCEEAQIDQVLINLIKNAVEAAAIIHASDKITVSCELQDTEDDWIIRISDNGPGISEEQRERIFIPFYTTKRDGSGIGLGLSRQIIQNHQGELSCEHAKEPTTFSIRIPKVVSF